MKKLGMAFVMGFLLVGLIFAQTPGRNQSLVVINTRFALGLDSVEVHVDGKKELVLGDKSSGSIIVNNGNHNLSFVSLNGYLNNTPTDTKNVTLTLNSQRVEIEVRIGAFHGVSVSTKSPTQLNQGSSSNNSSNNSNNDIEDAVLKICETIIHDLPKNKTIAVLSVSSRNRDMATFVVEELEFQLVDSREFRIVDRATLDKIRTEQNFQLSGEVDDNSAVSIGKMLGANIVITGTISGSGSSQRLTIKALDVQTAQIITMARESF
jgi:TolB-like protein